MRTTFTTCRQRWGFVQEFCLRLFERHSDVSITTRQKNAIRPKITQLSTTIILALVLIYLGCPPKIQINVPFQIFRLFRSESVGLYGGDDSRLT